MTITTNTIDRSTDSVAARVTDLRELAKHDPSAAQDGAWSWIERLRDQMPGPAAELELAQLFAAGVPADVDGQTHGILVGWLSAVPNLDIGGRILLGLARPVSRATMPWLGKKFDKAAGRGTNSVSRLGVVLTRLLAPRYKMHRAGDHWEGFDMLTRIEPSTISPETQVLVLDYQSPEVANPYPINRVRDEAVEIVPGISLGAKLWHQSNDYRLLAYWAAKAPVTR